MHGIKSALSRASGLNRYVKNEYGYFLYQNPDTGILQQTFKLCKLVVRYVFLRKPPRNIALVRPPIRGIPCMDAESAVEQRLLSTVFAQKLLDYDVISFDIFDTLILRKVDQPKSVFLFAEKTLNYVGYATVRAQVEADLRRTARQANHGSEITWDAIHQEVERLTGIPQETSSAAEMDAELMLCYANPYMRQVVRMLQAQGKTMIAVSDMYMNHTQICRLLAHCGYCDFAKVFVSCDYAVSKWDGSLYRIVRDALGQDQRMIHIGDNYEADILNAKKNGINSLYYKAVHDIGRNFRPSGLSPIVGTVYNGLVNAHLHCGLHTYSPVYEFGYLYGGLYVLGYCSWLKEKARQDGIEALLFLARDGDIYRKVFQLLDDELPTHYVHWSRSATLRCNAKRNRHDFLCRMVRHKVNALCPVTLESLMNYLSLHELLPELSKAGLHSTDHLTEENAPAFENFLLDHWLQVLSVYDREQQQAGIRMREVIGTAKRIALVDIGWTGIGLPALKALINEDWNINCDVRCLVSAGCSHTENETVNMLMTRQVEAYMFSELFNQDLLTTHLRSNAGLNTILMELLCQSAAPSFIGFSEDGQYRFDAPEVENGAAICEIHRGIMDFAKQYLAVAQQEPYLLSIPGRDAYLPFAHLCTTPQFFKKHFDDFLYMKTVGGSIGSARQETLGDILKAAGL